MSLKNLILRPVFILSPLLALFIACSTNDMEFEASEQSVSEQSVSEEVTEEEKEVPPPASQEESTPPTYVEETPDQSESPQSQTGADQELDCSSASEEVRVHWGTDSCDGFEDSLFGPYLMQDARVGTHPEYDRFVLEFAEDQNNQNGIPDSYRVFWSTDPPKGMASGENINFVGANSLEIYALGYAWDRDNPEILSPAPRTVSSARNKNIREAVSDGELEGVLHWVIGANQKSGFRVLSIPNPPRLVVDICTSTNS